MDDRRWGQQREKETGAGIATEGGRGAILLYKGSGRKRRWRKARVDELKTCEDRRLEQK